MTKIQFHNDNSVSVDGKVVIGTWGRVYNGKVDRGVKQGDWIGQTASDNRSPAFQAKGRLQAWFLEQVRRGATRYGFGGDV